MPRYTKVSELGESGAAGGERLGRNVECLQASSMDPFLYQFLPGTDGEKGGPT